jgi:hypothetical protein
MSDDYDDQPQQWRSNAETSREIARMNLEMARRTLREIGTNQESEDQ